MLNHNNAPSVKLNFDLSDDDRQNKTIKARRFERVSDNNDYDICILPIY